jgi:hypothetical protein
LGVRIPPAPHFKKIQKNTLTTATDSIYPPRVMKKPPKLKMNKMADNFIKKSKSHYLKLMHRDARDGDIDLLQMSAKDLADTLFVCYEIKNGNFSSAYQHYYELDSDVKDEFPNTLILMLIDAEEYEYNHNGEQ